MNTKSHHALMQTLQRLRFNRPGALSRLLLKAFCEDGGLIVGGIWSVELGLTEQNFSELRNQLKIARLLSWSEDVKRCRYSSGDNLLKYINRHLMEIQQFATKSEINEVKVRQDSAEDEITNLKRHVAEQSGILREHDARFLKLESIVAELEEVIGPPDTPDRRVKRSKLTADLNKHIKPN